jgi:hypothetical protein
MPCMAKQGAKIWLGLISVYKTLSDSIDKKSGRFKYEQKSSVPRKNKADDSSSLPLLIQNASKLVP